MCKSKRNDGQRFTLAEKEADTVPIGRWWEGGGVVLQEMLKGEGKSGYKGNWKIYIPHPFPSLIVQNKIKFV